MALFVHLTAEKNVRGIVRSGIKKGANGVFCLPILPSYVISHQWLRELRRGGQRTFVAIDFRIPDDELVTVAHYGKPAREMTAVQAVAVVREQEDPRGYEVVVPRAIGRRELHRVRRVNQVSGWRYAPDQHGRRPCACPVCLPKGAFKAADIRARYGDPPPPTKPELMARLAAAATPDEICEVLWSLGSRSRGDAADLAYLVEHPAHDVRADLAIALAAYRDRRAVELLRQLAVDPDPEVREAATDSLLARTPGS
ncbi:HEAT repeat domain-containing protein [Kibdelosporangium aridum]|uniref:HEAT repeat domain-containing protein n=1 Tax=Kibdelosporangium aridum TaxID=2030 RepID=A0A428ZDB7_KIBAR|nr:HEAT repeat domain-containing protein [Kibdelosporangium aridum]RSM86059.1 HEAT repeat domain-containing protein [Kibdelosporangium aridum]